MGLNVLFEYIALPLFLFGGAFNIWLRTKNFVCIAMLASLLPLFLQALDYLIIANGYNSLFCESTSYENTYSNQTVYVACTNDYVNGFSRVGLLLFCILFFYYSFTTNKSFEKET